MEMLLICRMTWAVLAEQVFSFDAAREWGFLGGIFAVKGMFPSLPAQGEGLGKGKGAVCLLSVFTAGKQTPVGGFVTWCELFTYAQRAAWLVAGKPWCPAGGVQEAFQQEEEMRQWVFKLTLCLEVGRPHRKCFCKQGSPSSCIAGSLGLYIAVFISVFSQSALYGWLAEVFSWWLQPCPAATAASQLWILPSAVFQVSSNL